MAATPTVLLRTDYVVLTQEHDGKIIRYRRTAVPFPTLQIAQQVYDHVLAVYERIGRRGRGLLVDSRDAVGRNDPEFEKLLLSFRDRAIPGFAAHVILMRTAVGILQAQRIDRSLRSDRKAYLTTDNEDDAIRFLQQQLDALSSA